MISLEEKILVHSVASHPNPSDQQRMRGLMNRNVDMDRVIDTAFKEGLAGFLYRSLMNSGVFDTLTEDQKERLQSLYYNTVVFNLKRIHELGTVLALLNQANIQVVLLQGYPVCQSQKVLDDISGRIVEDLLLPFLGEQHYRNVIGKVGEYCLKTSLQFFRCYLLIHHSITIRHLTSSICL